jgi:hypothetical protein
MILDRLNAFVWTCAIEIPIYTVWFRGRLPRTLSLIALAFGLQLLTQPLLWEFTGRAVGGWRSVLAAECLATGVEAMLAWVALRTWRAGPGTFGLAFAAALCANLASMSIGLLLNYCIYDW